MNNTLETFKSQQDKNIKLLHRLEQFLIQGEEFGIKIESHLINKLKVAQDDVSNDKLRIALIGGFSEGKTSIAAAWMEKLDKETMKISHQESSDEVKVYNVDTDIVLIDTPGLFGFKEKFNNDSRTIEKYKDITKKYVSEAHLILYVMNSTNPIKESHQEDLKWLFRTLNLLDRTIFVLSRFDEVADVEDNDDYQKNYYIKKENVSDRLQDIISLTSEEKEKLSIVAVAANPFDTGIDYWMENMEQFRNLSHIHLLQQATNEKIKQTGGVQALSLEVKNSIIQDIISSKLPIAIENDEKIQQQTTDLLNSYQALSRKMGDLNHQIIEAKQELIEFVSTYFSGLVRSVNGLSIETFNNFISDNIGNEGCIISAKLQSEFERRTGTINQAIENTQISYLNEINNYNANLTAFGKQGINYVIKSNLITPQSVLNARNGIVSTANLVGLDLSKLLKFKPWGAIKFANGTLSALAILGFAIEAWDSYQQTEQEKKFNEAKEKMKNDLMGQQKELLTLLNSSNFIPNFFREYVMIKDECDNLENILASYEKRKQQFSEWRKEVEIIDAEFSYVND